MPFKSKAQQRFMFAKHPKMARDWAHETKDIKSLPEKVKKATREEKSSPKMTAGDRLKSYIGGTLAAAAPAIPNKLLYNNLQKTEAGSVTTPEQASKLRQAMGSVADVHHMPDSGIEHAMYVGSSGKGTAVVPGKAGPHVAAHELGHGKFRQAIPGRVTAGLRPVGLAVGGGVPTLMALGDPDGGLSKSAPWVGAAASLPTLVDEGMASYHAIQGMRRAGFQPQQVSRGVRQLGKAFGTYGLSAAGMVAAPAVTRHLMKKYKAKKVQEKTAMTLSDRSIEAFFSELGKIANVAGDLTRTTMRAVAKPVSKVLTPMPALRKGVHPETVFGHGKAPIPSTAAARPKNVGPAQNPTRAGVAPKSVPIDGTRAGVRPNSVPPAAPAQPVQQPAASNLRRQLAIGGAIGAGGAMLGYALPHRQQNG